MDIKPCKCGCDDLIVWRSLSRAPEETITELEKIECPECGNVVWGSDEECIDDWNNERYDDA